jgi:hypothetical protein
VVVMPDGYLRSTVCFSILRKEWPSVRERLDQRIAAQSLRLEGPLRSPTESAEAGEIRATT